MNKDELLDPQTLGFGGRFQTCLPAMSREVAQDWFDNPQAMQETLLPLSKSPFVVRVDRLVKPVYPDWVQKVIHPELETVGPAEFNLKTDVSLWLHDGQKNGSVTTGNPIYEHLRDKDMLKTCLNLQDGIAIQKKGVAVSRKFFEGKAVLLWKSVVQNRDGNLRIPCLCEDDFQVLVHWLRLDLNFRGSDPAARFGK